MPSQPLSHFHNQQGGCLTRFLLLTIAVMVGAWLLPGIRIDSMWAVLLTAIVISLLNNIVRPILIVITLPAMLLSLGLTLFVINTLIIVMASAIVDGFHVDNFGWAMLFSLILALVNYLLELPNRYLSRPKLNDRHHDHRDEDSFTPYEEINE